MVAEVFIQIHIPPLDDYLSDRYCVEFKVYASRTAKFIPFLYLSKHLKEVHAHKKQPKDTAAKMAAFRQERQIIDNIPPQSLIG